MASVFAAAAHAPVTAILIVFEMTGDYRIILPLMLSVVVATAISQWIHKESIYTMRLSQKGIHLGLQEAKVLGAIQVRDAMSSDYELIAENLPMKELLSKVSQAKDRIFFVSNDKGLPTGVIKQEDLQNILAEAPLQGFVAKDAATSLSEVCFPDDPLSEVARQMAAHGIKIMPVADPDNDQQLIGVLKTENIFHSYANIVSKHSELVSRLEQDDMQSALLTSFVISPRSSLAGKWIREIGLPDGVVLSSLRREKNLLSQKGIPNFAQGTRFGLLINPKAGRPSGNGLKFKMRNLKYDVEGLWI